MRKLLVLLFVVMFILFQADATEPANILSLGLLCFIKFTTFESNSIYNFNNSLSDNELYMLMISQQVADRNMKLEGAFSWKMPTFALDAYKIYTSKESFEFIFGNGDIDITQPLDIQHGEMTINVIYEDVELNYIIDNEVKNANIDVQENPKSPSMKIPLLIYQFQQMVFSVSDGSKEDGNGTIEIVFNAKPKSSILAEYRAKEILVEKQKNVIALLQEFKFIPWNDMGLASSSIYSEFIKFARTNRCLDVLDCLTVFYIENENGLSSVLDTFPNLIDSTMYINGELAEDINISGAMDVVGLVMNFIT